VEKIVYMDRNVYKDNIIEVEKTVYVDVPVPMENVSYMSLLLMRFIYVYLCVFM